MRSKGTDGARVESVSDEVSFFLNKNTVPGDKSALIPSGVRIGSAAMTTRGCKEADYIECMKFLERVAEASVNIAKKVKGKKLSDFK